MMRIVAAVFGLLALLGFTYAPQQLFVPGQTALRVPAQQVRMPGEYEMRPIEPVSMPAPSMDAGLLGWGLVGFAGAVAGLAVAGYARGMSEDAAKRAWLAKQETGYSPAASQRSRPAGGAQHFAHGRVVPMRDQSIPQTAADVGGPEWVPNAAGTEWVRNTFGGRSVNPSHGLVLDAGPSQAKPFHQGVGAVRSPGAVRQTVHALDEPEFVLNTAGTEWVRNDFSGRAVNPSTGLGGAQGSPSAYQAPRSVSPTGAVRQTVADMGGAEFVMNAAGTEWVRNDFGGRPVNPSTGLGGAVGSPSTYRANVRSPSPTGAIRQTVSDVENPEFVLNAAGTEWVRNDFGGRPVNPSTGLYDQGSVAQTERYSRPVPQPTGAIRQTAADMNNPEFVPNAAGTEMVRNSFGGRPVNPSTGLYVDRGSPAQTERYSRPVPQPTGAIRQTAADMNNPEWVPNAAGSEMVRNSFGGRPVNPSTGLYVDRGSPAQTERYSRPVPQPTGAIRQTAADMNNPEWVPNAAGSEMVRNSFGGRPVNPSHGLQF